MRIVRFSDIRKLNNHVCHHPQPRRGVCHHPQPQGLCHHPQPQGLCHHPQPRGVCYNPQPRGVCHNFDLDLDSLLNISPKGLE